MLSIVTYLATRYIEMDKTSWTYCNMKLIFRALIVGIEQVEVRRGKISPRFNHPQWERFTQVSYITTNITTNNIIFVVVIFY